MIKQKFTFKYLGSTPVSDDPGNTRDWGHPQKGNGLLFIFRNVGIGNRFTFED